MGEALGSIANTEKNRRGIVKKLISKVISESGRSRDRDGTPAQTDIHPSHNLHDKATSLPTAKSISQ